MSTFKRHRFAWSHNELEKLHREYENHELTVQQIAELHERSVCSIFAKLKSEGLIAKWEAARGWSTYAEEMEYPKYSKSNKKVSIVEDEEYDRYNIHQQIGFMQTHLSNIRKIVTDLLYESSNNAATANTKNKSKGKTVANYYN